jgi:hypothetical protein
MRQLGSLMTNRAGQGRGPGPSGAGRRRRFAPLALWALAALAGAPARLAAQEAAPATAALNEPWVLTERCVKLRGDTTNIVRTGPGNGYAMIGVFAGGSRFPVIAKRDDWYNVRLSATDTGWIHASLCEEYGDMSGLEFRPNPRLFSRVGSFSFSLYSGGYAFDRKSNSLVLGTRLGYYLLEYVGIEGTVGWTHVVRPAEIVESLFDLALEEEDFHMLYYALSLDLKLMPGRQMVPFVTLGAGSAIMQGESEAALNYGAGIDFFVRKSTAAVFAFRSINMDSGTGSARRANTNYEFSVGSTFLF